MIKSIRKRNGKLEKFQSEKVTWAIYKAAAACGGKDFERAEYLCSQVVETIERKYGEDTPDVESIQDMTEKVLIENGHAQTAKAFILYREKRKSAREINALIGATIDMFQIILEIRTGIYKRTQIRRRV